MIDVKPRAQISTAVAFASLACLAAYATGEPLVIAAVAVAPIGFAIACKALDRPFDLVLLFVVFSFFRIHEAFPFLMPFRLPSLLAAGTFAALGWSIVLRRSMKLYLAPELVVFLAFFLHMTVGLVFAGDRPAAIKYYTQTYYKIAVMTFAIAWLMREPRDFARTTVGILIGGMGVACVALWNKANGIGLVEGTRVTIGRSFQSSLGDPNDLSLVLLFPMAFAAAMVVTRGGAKSARIFGVLMTALLISAVIATQSRGGILGILAVWGVIANRYVRNKWILAGGGLVAGLILMVVAGISKRQSGGAHEEGLDESAEGRLHAWMAAWRMATVHPFVGVGLDNFLQNYFFYSDFWDGVPHAVHSTWFVVIAEGGFPAITLFLIMIGMMVRLAVISMRTLDRLDAPVQARTLALALVAGIAGFCVSGTFLTQGFTWPIYIKLALVSALAQYAKRYAAEREPLAAAPAAASQNATAPRIPQTAGAPAPA